MSCTSGNMLDPKSVPTPMQQGVNNLVSNAQGPIAGNASGTTRSAISAGTVVITDNAGQLAKTGKDADATIAGLNRDTAHANDGAIGKIFDKEKVEERQEIARLQAQVVQQVAPLLYKQVGNFLEKQPTEVRVAVHALVGGLISRAMGGEFVAGAAGAGLATRVMETLGKELDNSETLRKLSPDDRKTLMQLVSGAIGGVVAGAVSGSGSAAAAAGATSQMAEQFNRQLHPDEQTWIRDHAKEFARQEHISEDQAIERLSQQAAKQVDYLWRAQLADGDDAAAKAFLNSSRQTFTNQLGEQQKLFTDTDQQLLRPEMFADTADPTFYQRFVQSGVSRQLNDGLIKELKDSGIDIKNGAAEFAKIAKEHPGVVLDAVWGAVKGLPGAIVDGFRESGQAIGEGAAVSSDKDLTDKLNAIYGTDVSCYQQALLAVRIALGVTGAVADAKVVTGLSEAATKKAAEIVAAAKAAREAKAAAAAAQEAEAAAKAGQETKVAGNGDAGGQAATPPIGAKFDEGIADHLTKFDGFSQKTGISGTHNLDEFMKAAAQYNVKIINRAPGSAKGVFNIEYQIPALDRAGNVAMDATGAIVYKNQILVKTVYDPMLISDREIIDLGRQAAQSGYGKAIMSGAKAYNSEAGGIPFRVYIDTKNGRVTNYHQR
ncbi:CdiA family toxin C-terminal domain-containing protein [Ralstonia solanacearum]|uniref:CdiA family toxin C-terminal domain-containing protein n=1 Tax=Ralstonia solanacearum TaxID=305 RepID=UPI000A9FB67E|nr:CdiA family toxin C-terminal domain-containing protein [Ralstonia solanacearum]